jgi:hypothetical protein
MHEMILHRYKHGCVCKLNLGIYGRFFFCAIMLRMCNPCIGLLGDFWNRYRGRFVLVMDVMDKHCHRKNYLIFCCDHVNQEYIVFLFIY